MQCFNPANQKLRALFKCSVRLFRVHQKRSARARISCFNWGHGAPRASDSSDGNSSSTRSYCLANRLCSEIDGWGVRSTSLNAPSLSVVLAYQSVFPNTPLQIDITSLASFWGCNGNATDVSNSCIAIRSECVVHLLKNEYFMCRLY